MEPPNIRSVLVATALDDRASSLVGQASALATSAGAELHVLHVVEDDGKAGDVEEARARLAERVDGVLPDGAEASRSVRTGSARDAIVERAQEVSADVVVVGPNRGGGLKERILGGTAQSLVGDDGLAAHTAVLVVGEEAADPGANVVVAVDRSDWTPGVLAWGRALARLTGASLSVLHVFRPMYGGAAGVVSGVDARRRLQDDQREQVEEELRAEVARAGLEGPDARVTVESGEPASAIVHEAERRAAGLVVMGSRGAGAAERALLGSVASDVIRDTGRSVLVVRRADPGD